MLSPGPTPFVSVRAFRGSFLIRSRRGDPMAEDAAYLRLIALQRMGADGDMKRAAKAYLEQFPSGFRHAEVERLAR